MNSVHIISNTRSVLDLIVQVTIKEDTNVAIVCTIIHIAHKLSIYIGYKVKTN